MTESPCHCRCARAWLIHLVISARSKSRTAKTDAGSSGWLNMRSKWWAPPSTITARTVSLMFCRTPPACHGSRLPLENTMLLTSTKFCGVAEMRGETHSQPRIADSSFTHFAGEVERGPIRTWLDIVRGATGGNEARQIKRRWRPEHVLSPAERRCGAKVFTFTLALRYIHLSGPLRKRLYHLRAILIA